MDPETFDNRSRIVKDDIAARIEKGDRICVAAAYFSIYGFKELKKELESCGEFRFVYTDPTYIQKPSDKAQREFYIPRLGRERSLYGTEFEIKLRNELTQRSIAKECAAWVRRKARFKSFRQSQGLQTMFGVRGDCGECVYFPFDELTTKGLGTAPGSSEYTMITRMGAPVSATFLQQFDRAWNDERNLEDVTDQVIESMTTVYAENSPESIYYLALYNIFSEFLEDVSEDNMPNTATGYRDSAIWGKLYDFQRDAAVSIINKLETYSGCILADSVGLGKTFTALAVIKYYESRNRNVLVLCPKKLKDNWLTYRSNQKNNPIAGDRLRYDVLFHTDLSRDHGMSATGMDLSLIDWGNYDLVVIDESHNFRNGAASANVSEGEENRYLKLLNKVVRDGVKTKVLMLSATPVNNRFYDLRNQLALAYDGDKAGWAEKLGLDNDLDTVFQRAQKAFNAWDKLPVEQRTTDSLSKMLDFDFYRVLDQVTVARSRKHIQRHYDMSALGPFPRREDPLPIRAKLTDLPDAINYPEIYGRLDELSLCVYMPSSYLLPSRAAKYAKDLGNSNLTVAGRESGIKKLMAVNLLKRLESSVHSFLLTLEKIRGLVADTDKVIDDFIAGKATSHKVADVGSAAGLDLDGDDEEEPFFEVGGKVSYEVADLDYISWQRDLERDLATLDLLISMVKDINPEHDAKLAKLEEVIANKAEHPLNPGNRKVIVFTAFADTADYLYQNIAPWAKETLGLETCEITGQGNPRCTIQGAPKDMNLALTMFSPESKELDVVMPGETRRIDILIATDCISEGQNLQDCDYVVNYDIHWNPVRVIQRFGRVDRIGSRNGVIQLVNFWPDVELDEYIRLKSRMEERMRATVLTSTGDDDLLNADEKGDLEYREAQLRKMQSENIDLEDVSGGASITDLGLNEFRMDLVDYYEHNPGIDSLPHGLHAVVRGEEPGVLFVLRNVNQGVNIQHRNQLHPFYLVYMKEDGTVLHGHLEPKAVLDEMRLLCRGKDVPDRGLCAEFNREIRDGRDMRACSQLLEAAVGSIVEAKQESDVDSFFSDGTTGFLEDDVEGLDDFELICFLAVR